MLDMLGFLYHSYSHQFSFIELRLTAFTRVRPCIHPTPPTFKSFKPSMAFWKASMAFSSPPNDLLERYFGSWRSWTNFNIHKKKQLGSESSPINFESAILSERLASQFFQAEALHVSNASWRSYQFNCSWSWFCLHSSNMFKQNTLSTWNCDCDYHVGHFESKWGLVLPFWKELRKPTLSWLTIND